MKSDKQKSSAGKIQPLVINGLHGRVLRLPANNNKYAGKDILMLYGLHSSIERMIGIVENVADYGNVTMPDLPGFGGMDSFYSIGQVASIDAMADYLATFVKLHYKGKKFSIVAMSYGFVVATRMLSKYPDIAAKVELVVSLAGLTDKQEFIVPKTTFAFWKFTSVAFDGPIRAWLFRYVILQPVFIRTIYGLQAKSHPKMKGADKAELKKRIDFEIHLWHANDVRTYVHVTRDILRLKTPPAQIESPCLHVSISTDQYVDHVLVEKHIKELYTKVSVTEAKMPNHAPTIISDKKEAAAFIPSSVRRKLAQLHRAK
jgi:pimeloyl-ACP methyl ester carboxylesterase